MEPSLLGGIGLAVAFAAAALWLLALLVTRPTRLQCIAVAGGAAMVSAALYGLWPRATPEAEVDDRPAQVAEDGYVSSSRCRACHPSQYASWRASWHRTMTQVATPQSVVGDFDDVTVQAYGQSYHLERRGDQFWVEQGDASGNRQSRRVVMTTGAHHEQDYWLETPGTRRVGFLPLMYLVGDAQWIPFTAGFLRPPVTKLPPAEALDKWHFACIKCHATHGKPRDRLGPAAPVDTRVAELGIACEACHGPAAEHAARNRDPLRRYRLHASGDPDETIVHPERLDAARASEICGQCHSINKPLSDFSEAQANAADWHREGLRYRPGDVLEQTRYLVQPEHRDDPQLDALRAADPHYLEDRFWSDGEVRVSGREYAGLIASPCFERGRGERKLSCLSCHDMHTGTEDPAALSSWADDQLAPGMRTNAACLDCHEHLESEPALVAHTRHAPDSSGSECMNCHMPYTTYGLLKAIRSHTITSPSISATRETGRPDACGLCHLDRSSGWTAAELARGWGIEAPELPPIMQRVPLSVVWTLGGDAGQRVLFAWAMGWSPALEVSQQGRGWQTPFLAQLLVDPYDAVRYVAARSLRAQPGFADLRFDFVGPPEDRVAVAREVAISWAEARRAAGEPTDPGFLVDDPRGELPADLFDAILAQRSQRRVDLAE